VATGGVEERAVEALEGDAGGGDGAQVTRFGGSTRQFKGIQGERQIVGMRVAVSGRTSAAKTRTRER